MGKEDKETWIVLFTKIMSVLFYFGAGQLDGATFGTAKCFYYMRHKEPWENKKSITTELCHLFPKLNVAPNLKSEFITKYVR